MDLLDSYRTPTVASGEVQAKLDLLKTCERNISELERQLSQARILRESLIEDLGEHARPRAWIDILPDELLCIIIEHTIRSKRPRIGRFLFINKRFHLLVVNTPSLWTQIDIDVEDPGYMPGWLSFYVTACLKYSQDLLIEVRMNLSAQVPQATYIRNAVETRFMELVDEYEEENVSNMLDEMNFHLGCSSYETHFDDLFEQITEVVGNDGCNMRRWKSLILFLPANNQLCGTLMKMFSGPTPQLRILEIMDGYHTEIKKQIEEYGAFPDLAAVHTLTVDWGEPWFLSLNRAGLVDLIITLSSTSDLDHLIHCTSLQHLAVRYRGADEEEEASKGSVCLPALLSLRVSGTIGPVLARLSTPALEELRVSSAKLRPEQSLSSVSLVKWTLPQRDAFWNKAQSLELLERILRNASSTKTVTLSGFYEPTVKEVAQNLRTAKALPTQLRVVFSGHRQDVVILERSNGQAS